MSEINRGITPSHIRAIETEYRGYKFRSRLEARWAIVFDYLGLAWQYEPEGFERIIDSQVIRYLPDFYLVGDGMWIEVKGSEHALRADAEKLHVMVDCESPLPLLDGSYKPAFRDTKCNELPIGGLLLLGAIPEKCWGISLHPLMQNSGNTLLDNVIRTWATITPYGIRPVPVRKKTWVEEIFGIPTDEIINTAEQWSLQHYFFQTPRAWRKVHEAFDVARQARFEYPDFDARERTLI